MSKAKERDGFWIIFIFLNVITCENSARLGCHVNLVLPGDAQHHGFGPPVVLGGQQPAQRLGKNPAWQREKDMEAAEKEGWEQNMLWKQEEETQGGKKSNRKRKRVLFTGRSRVFSVLCSAVCTVQAIAWLSTRRIGPPATEFLRGWDSPDVGQHQNERADYDDLQDLPVIAVRPIAAQSGHPWHE